MWWKVRWIGNPRLNCGQHHHHHYNCQQKWVTLYSSSLIAGCFFITAMMILWLTSCYINFLGQNHSPSWPRWPSPQFHVFDITSILIAAHIKIRCRQMQHNKGDAFYQPWSFDLFHCPTIFLSSFRILCCQSSPRVSQNLKMQNYLCVHLIVVCSPLRRYECEKVKDVSVFWDISMA